MSRLKPACFYLLVVVYGLFLVACSDPNLVCEDSLGCIRVGANDPIRLGYLLALSGDAGYLGRESLQGIEIALAERDNLLLGHPIELVGGDTQCRVEDGRLKALETADNPLLLGVIGATCSAVSEVAIPIINRAELVMISPSSSRADLLLTDSNTSGVWQRSFFRTVPNSLWQGVAAAEFAVNGLGVTTAAVIYDETAGSDALRRAFTEAFMRLGGRVMFVRQWTVGQTDIADVVTMVNSGQPELLYLPLFEPEAGLLINTLPLNQDRLLLGTDRLLLPSFAQSGGTAVQGMALTGPTVTGTAYEAIREQWMVTYGDEPTGPYFAYAYEATTMLLTAIEAVAQQDGDDALLIGRQALRDALAEMVFTGVSGQLICEEGECSGKTAVGVYQLTNEQILDSSWPPPLIWQPPE